MLNFQGSSLNIQDTKSNTILDMLNFQLCFICSLLKENSFLCSCQHIYSSLKFREKRETSTAGIRGLIMHLLGFFHAYSQKVDYILSSILV